MRERFDDVRFATFELTRVASRQRAIGENIPGEIAMSSPSIDRFNSFHRDRELIRGGQKRGRFDGPRAGLPVVAREIMNFRRVVKQRASFVKLVYDSKNLFFELIFGSTREQQATDA